MSSAVEPRPSLQREWWLRTLAIFQRPELVFGGLRDDSGDAAEARAEPVAAISVLAGIAGILSTSFAGRLLDQRGFDGVNVAIWAFFGGAVLGLTVYWFGGLIVHALARGLGGSSSYRQARHVVGFAAAPVALLLLLVWPIRLAIYGGDVFRSGGSDSGLGDKVFEALVVAAFAWMVALVIAGMRALNGWSWPRRR